MVPKDSDCELVGLSLLLPQVIKRVDCFIGHLSSRRNHPMQRPDIQLLGDILSPPSLQTLQPSLILSPAPVKNRMQKMLQDQIALGFSQDLGFDWGLLLGAEGGMACCAVPGPKPP